MALKPCPHCGHPISEKAEKCPECHQDPHLSPEELAQQNAAKKAKRKHTLLIGGICAVVLLAVSGVCAALFLPDYLEYRAAYNLLKLQDYVAAAEAFDTMGDYRDSAQQALEARYQYVTSHKSREDKQTRLYLRKLVEASYKDASQLESEIYCWEITVIPCGSKTGGLEKSFFGRNEPLFFYVEVHGGRPDELRYLRFEATIYPNPYGQALGVQTTVKKEDMGGYKDGGYFWYGWENGVGSSTIGSIYFNLYDSQTNALIKTCSAAVF